MVITTAQLESTNPELRFCAGSNSAHSRLEIRNSEDLRQWSRAGNKANCLSSVKHTTKTIHQSINRVADVEIKTNETLSIPKTNKNINALIKKPEPHKEIKAEILDNVTKRIKKI